MCERKFKVLEVLTLVQLVASRNTTMHLLETAFSILLTFRNSVVQIENIYGVNIKTHMLYMAGTKSK